MDQVTIATADETLYYAALMPTSEWQKNGGSRVCVIPGYKPASGKFPGTWAMSKLIPLYLPSDLTPSLAEKLQQDGGGGFTGSRLDQAIVEYLLRRPSATVQEINKRLKSEFGGYEGDIRHRLHVLKAQGVVEEMTGKQRYQRWCLTKEYRGNHLARLVREA